MRYASYRLSSIVVTFFLFMGFVVPSVFAADTVCNFRAKGLNLNFGIINPSIVQTIVRPITVATTFANQAGDCIVGGNMTVDIVGPSTRLLVNGINTISYTISGFPIVLPKPGNAPPGNPGTGYVTWFNPGQLQGTILWSAYADAPAGSYIDNVILSVTP
ncbi:MAG: hypothetical protein H7224_02985 [Polaromonas sp.]|nr:hypothetical protein [Polaromonas sp.]